MLNWERGTSAAPDARLKGEVLGALSTWQADFNLVRLELAWTVVSMLLKHVRRSQALDVYIEFIERLADITGEEARELKKVIMEDFRRRAH